VKSFFIVSVYKPNAAFCALKTDVISACDNAALYTIAVAIFPLNALDDLSPGSQAIKKLRPDKAVCEKVLVAVVIPFVLHKKAVAELALTVIAIMDQTLFGTNKLEFQL
jgi:hypothetical protein